MKILRLLDDFRYIKVVFEDIRNLLFLQVGLFSYREYYNVILEFQLYLCVVFIELCSDNEFSFIEKINKFLFIKVIVIILGFELCDYVRNENRVFLFKWVVNCC